LTGEDEGLTVHVKYKDVRETFKGSPEQVWLAVKEFFDRFLSSFDIANRFVLSVDLQKLAIECQGLITFSPEGANLMIERSKLTDNESLQLWLLAAYLGFQLGKLKQEDVNKSELQERIGKSGKIVSTRLSELTKNRLVVKTSEDRFGITTFGILQMQKDLLGKVRAKLDV
jgi:hypothetical protein